MSGATGQRTGLFLAVRSTCQQVADLAQLIIERGVSLVDNPNHGEMLISGP